MKTKHNTAFWIFSAAYLTVWFFLPLAGAQSAFILSLINFNFNTTFVVVLFFIAVRGVVQQQVLFYLIGFLCFCFFLSLFANFFEFFQTTEWLEFFLLEAENQLLTNLEGPGLFHGPVFILSFSFFIMYVFKSNKVIDQFWTKEQTTFLLVSTPFFFFLMTGVVSWGFCTGAYWAYFVATWGNWFNNDPVELLYCILLIIFFHSLHYPLQSSFVVTKAHVIGNLFISMLCTIRSGVLLSRHSNNSEAISLLELLSGSWLLLGLSFLIFSSLWKTKPIQKKKAYQQIIKHYWPNFISFWLILPSLIVLWGFCLIYDLQNVGVNSLSFAALWLVTWILFFYFFFFFYTKSYPTNLNLLFWNIFHYIFIFVCFGFLIVEISFFFETHINSNPVQQKNLNQFDLTFLLTDVADGPLHKNTATLRASTQPTDALDLDEQPYLTSSYTRNLTEDLDELLYIITVYPLVEISENNNSIKSFWSCLVLGLLKEQFDIYYWFSTVLEIDWVFLIFLTTFIISFFVLSLF